MNVTNTCAQCHNTTFHFDPHRHAIVCDICGTALSGSDEAQNQLQYDKNRQKAIALVKARDYQGAREYLNHMYNAKPDDSDIFYLHLMGLTECCTDLLLEQQDNAKLLQAGEYWKTFCALNGDPTRFLAYGEKRKQALTKRIDKNISKYLLLSILCYALLLISTILLFMQWYYAIIGIVAAIILIFFLRPLIHLSKNMVKSKHYATNITPFEQNL